MAATPSNTNSLAKMLQAAKNTAMTALKLQKITLDLTASQLQAEPERPVAIIKYLKVAAKSLISNPEPLKLATTELCNDMVAAVKNLPLYLQGKKPEPVIKPLPSDNRFQNDSWNEEPFAAIKQSYLLGSRWLTTVVNNIDYEDVAIRQKVIFHSNQLIDALAPSNFILTNPVVLNEARDTNGDSLIRGLDTMQQDFARGGGKLVTNLSDPKPFIIGKTVAITPGKVIFRNKLFELIQYCAKTEQVYQRPLLIVPPWINKYYILDLQPQNSFVAWLVEQGYSTFIMSWVNPDKSLFNMDQSDYVMDGIMAAIDEISNICPNEKINAIGYCMGGTLLSMAVARMAAVGDMRINSASFFTTQIDFKQAGDIKAFIDSDITHFDMIDVYRTGYQNGHSLASHFNSLRANQLVWPFFINTYLLGREARAFDMLRWSSDPTNIAFGLHLFCVYVLYEYNQLIIPNATMIAGVPIDLGKINIPTYHVATVEDHIVLAEHAFNGIKYFGGDRQFILAGAGHVAGVVNPPKRKKYGYRTNQHDNNYTDFELWKIDAIAHEGSWWLYWEKWLAGQAGEQVAARIPNEAQVICDSPGTYVKITIDDLQ